MAVELDFTPEDITLKFYYRSNIQFYMDLVDEADTPVDLSDYLIKLILFDKSTREVIQVFSTEDGSLLADSSGRIHILPRIDQVDGEWKSCKWDLRIYYKDDNNSDNEISIIGGRATLSKNP